MTNWGKKKKVTTFPRSLSLSGSLSLSAFPSALPRLIIIIIMIMIIIIVITVCSVVMVMTGCRKTDFSLSLTMSTNSLDELAVLRHRPRRLLRFIHRWGTHRRR